MGSAAKSQIVPVFVTNIIRRSANLEGGRKQAQETFDVGAHRTQTTPIYMTNSSEDVADLVGGREQAQDTSAQSPNRANVHHEFHQKTPGVSEFHRFSTRLAICAVARSPVLNCFRLAIGAGQQFEAACFCKIGRLNILWVSIPNGYCRCDWVALRALEPVLAIPGATVICILVSTK